MTKNSTKTLIIWCFCTLLIVLQTIMCNAQPVVRFLSDSTDTSTDWTQNDTWTGGSPPDHTGLGNKDLVEIATGHAVTLSQNLVTNNSGNEIYIRGTLTLTGSAQLMGSNGLEVFVSPTGTLNLPTWNGTGNKNNITINNSGTVYISGDMTVGNNSVFLIDGELIVDGTLTVGQNSSISGSGSVTAGDCVDQDGENGFCENEILPVELLFFNAHQTGGQVVLEWSTASEKNNDFFTIERSRDGVSFNLLATIQGNGTVNSTTDYNYTDPSPPLGLTYYRLSQTDYDGTTEQFPMVSVLFSPINGKLHVYPNPAEGSFMQLQASGRMQNESLILRIINLQGKLMDEKTVQADQFGNVDLPIDISSLQRSNTYIFNLVSAKENEFLRVTTK